MNRIAVSAPVVGTANRITGTASVTVQPTVGRQLSINTVATPSSGTVSRIVIPSQQVGIKILCYINTQQILS